MKLKRNTVLVLSLFIFLFTLGFSTKAQWQKNNSGITSALYAVDFVNDQIGYATGDNGVVLKTINAGASWTKLTTNTTDLLYSLHFISEKVGYAAGGSTVIKTADGGNSWMKLSHTATGIIEVYFIDAKIGFISGDGGTFLKTEDGGNTWSSLNNTGQGSNERIDFIDGSTGFVAGSNIVRTTDGGSTWKKVYGTSTSFFYSIYFVNNKVGFACGPGEIVKTSDGGVTWVKQSPNTQTHLRDVVFLNENMGYVVGGHPMTGERDVVLKTTDGGTNWKIDTTKLGPSFFRYLNGIALSNTGDLYVVNMSGSIYKNETGVTSTFLPKIPGDNGNYKEIRVFPNPVNSFIILNLDQTEQMDYQIRIFDQTGSLMLENMYSKASRLTVDVSTFPSGVYWLQTANAKTTQVSKIIIQH